MGFYGVSPECFPWRKQHFVQDATAFQRAPGSASPGAGKSGAKPDRRTKNWEVSTLLSTRNISKCTRNIIEHANLFYVFFDVHLINLIYALLEILGAFQTRSFLLFQVCAPQSQKGTYLILDTGPDCLNMSEHVVLSLAYSKITEQTTSNNFQQPTSASEYPILDDRTWPWKMPALTSGASTWVWVYFCQAPNPQISCWPLCSLRHCSAGGTRSQCT